MIVAAENAIMRVVVQFRRLTPLFAAGYDQPLSAVPLLDRNEGVFVPGTCVIGLQWGDEAKGKLVDLLTSRFQIVVRYQGGANAGHTVVVGDKTYKLHHVPSGILTPGVMNVVTPGVV